jgi:hypothetical protein
MPNVPNVPGVPALPSYTAAAVTLLISDLVSGLIGSSPPVWGIYLDGAPALPDARSMVSFGYKQDWTISDYPVEEGGFQSYDKVQLPFDARVRISSEGSPTGRAALLAALDVVANSLDLYDIVTPEKVYSSVNVTHVDYDREAARGVGMLLIDVWFIEIRVSATAEFSNTQQPPNQGAAGVGNVQPQTPNQYVQQNFSSGNWTVN